MSDDDEYPGLEEAEKMLDDQRKQVRRRQIRDADRRTLIQLVTHPMMIFIIVYILFIA